MMGTGRFKGVLAWAGASLLIGSLGASQASAAVIFNFNYQDAAGTGFNDATLGAQRQAALEDVAANIGSLLQHDATVDINVNASETDGTGALASAGANLNLFNGDEGFFHRNVAQRIINGEDRNGATADGTMTWDFGYSWYLGTGSPGGSAFDFRTVALHEITHLLGFAARVDQNGNGFDPGGDGGGHAYNIFDMFLENASGVALIDPNTNRYNTLASLSDMTTGQVFFDGTNVRNANGGLPAELYTPSTYQAGSSMSHFGFDDPMDPATALGQVWRDWSDLDIALLRDLGYTVLPEPGSLVASALLMGLLLRRRRGTIA